VIVDEAYQEFAPRDSLRAHAAAGPRAARGFAHDEQGVRVRRCARRLSRRRPGVIDALRLVRLPYHLSALTQAAAIAALRHAPAMLAMVDEIVAQRDRISATLDALGYEPFESWTNFVLFAGVDDPAATWQGLYDRAF
jgi:histidinol-phosphate aminotransferase